MYKYYFNSSILTSIKFEKGTKIIFLLLFFFPFLLQSQSLQWAKRIGGPEFDGAYSIAIDKDGNVYTVGLFTDSVDFDPGSGIYSFGEEERLNTYVSKLDANGVLIWAKQIGQNQNTMGFSVLVDSLKNVIIAGEYLGTVDFDPGPGNYSLPAASPGFWDAFILKLDSVGNFVWAGRFGATLDDYINSIDLDADGNIYITGLFANTVDFNPAIDTYTMTSAGKDDAFICKLSKHGIFQWAHRLGGPEDDQANSISVDAIGNVYIIGEYRATVDLNTGPLTELHTATDSGLDIFVLKLESAGNFIWANSIGGKDAEHGMTIKVDNSGNLFLAGAFKDSVDFDSGPGETILYEPGRGDIFVARYDTSGILVWVKQIGSSDFDIALSIDADANGNVYTTGYFMRATDFDPGTGTFILDPGSVYHADAFISKLDYNGNFVWAERIGGAGSDYGRSIAVNPTGNIYACGFYEMASSFNSSPFTYLLSAGWSDCYVVKYLSSNVSVSDLSIEHSLKLYPVPAANQLTLEFSRTINKCHIEILNTLGACIYNETSINTQVKTIDLTNFGTGIYLLRLHDGAKIYTEKFVKY